VALTATVTVSNGKVLTRTQSFERSIVSWTIWALLAPVIVTFDRRLPVARDALLVRFLFHLPLSFCSTAINLYADSTLTAINRGLALPITLDAVREWFTGPFQGRFIYYWVVLLIYSTFDYASHLKEGQVRTAELERLVSESRLAALRARLHPHFLFNALNTISAHVERSPRTARRMLEELGELLRLSLAHAEDAEIPLAQEIGFIERYLDLQKARFEERLTATVKVDPETLHALVPTFILQPLVENAIRYGTAAFSGKSRVEVEAWRSDGKLHLRVRDDGPGLPPGWDPERSTGIGISNTRERLQRLYGEQAQTFKLASDVGKGVCVDLEFPFRDSNVAQRDAHS
jgi:two-component system LytT family sensor kinase